MDRTESVTVAEPKSGLGADGPACAAGRSRQSGKLGAVDTMLLVVALPVVGGLFPLGALLRNGPAMASMFLLDGAIRHVFALVAVVIDIPLPALAQAHRLRHARSTV